MAKSATIKKRPATSKFRVMASTLYSEFGLDITARSEKRIDSIFKFLNSNRVAANAGKAFLTTSFTTASSAKKFEKIGSSNATTAGKKSYKLFIATT